MESLGNDAFIRRKVGFVWLREYLHSWYEAAEIKQYTAKELEELKSAMGGREVEVRWPFDLVLATKR